MRFYPTMLPEVIVVEPCIFHDERGSFLESYHAQKFAEAGISARFVQDNHAYSRHGILRGLHMQHWFPQGKLVRCIEGEIFDVAVDARRGSKTFGRWVGERLSARNLSQLWVPPGFLHGYCVLSERAQVEYKCTELYHPEDEVGVLWDDPEIGISWPISTPALSAKDAAWPRLRDMYHA
jgi:dTDP-4-dehydrorhamnose 3,5-epimerase